MNEIVAYQQKPLTASEIVEQKRLIQQVMEKTMKTDVHFGVIPGTKKRTLYKPGSEAILSTFRIAVVPEVFDLGNEDYVRYRVHAKGVTPDGTVIGVGIGECSSNEEKYRWRAAVCEEEFEDTPDNRRRVKYVAKWNNKTRQKDQIEKIKQIRTEPADIANTILKMAKKRAQIDLTLTATGASDIFDQDLEDLPEEIRDELTAEDRRPTGGKPKVEQPQAAPQPTDKPVTENQAKMLWAKLNHAGITDTAFCLHFGIEAVEALPFAKMNDALKAIQDGAIQEAAQPEPCPNCGQYDSFCECGQASNG